MSNQLMLSVLAIPNNVHLAKGQAQLRERARSTSSTGFQGQIISLSLGFPGDCVKYLAETNYDVQSLDIAARCACS